MSKKVREKIGKETANFYIFPQRDFDSTISIRSGFDFAYEN